MLQGLQRARHQRPRGAKPVWQDGAGTCLGWGRGWRINVAGQMLITATFPCTCQHPAGPAAATDPHGPHPLIYPPSEGVSDGLSSSGVGLGDLALDPMGQSLGNLTHGPSKRRKKSWRTEAPSTEDPQLLCVILKLRTLEEHSPRGCPGGIWACYPSLDRLTAPPWGTSTVLTEKSLLTTLCSFHLRETID